MKRGILYMILMVVAVMCATTTWAQKKPRVVVNIVLTTMNGDDLERYADNFSQGGFRRLTTEGVTFANATYGYMQTLTPVSLATLSTGATPSTHGVVCEAWWDHITNKRTTLVDDSSAHSLRFSTGTGNYSAKNLLAESFGDAVVKSNEESRVATIAIEPMSAIVMNGKRGVAYWMETLKTHWTTSSCYVDELPEWVATYNQEEWNKVYQLERWNTLLPYDRYHNSQVSKIEGLHSKEGKRIDFVGTEDMPTVASLHQKMCYTPAGNSAIFAFAKQTFGKLQMGRDEAVDVLNIVLDTPEKIATVYGAESVEYEDMLYRLDRDIEDFIAFTTAQLSSPEEMVIVLTAAHGTSPSYNATKEPQSRFNVMQAEVIVNAYLGSQYGNAEWVLGYENRNIYLNHNLIKEKKLSIPALQHEVATFCMQLKGVSHALAADALRNSYFGSGYAQKIQNGYYPKRSGDVVINLMPGYIEEQQTTRSASGSMYRYDVHVPLVVYGGGVQPRVVEEMVDMTSVVPTIAKMVGIAAPTASEGEILKVK